MLDYLLANEVLLGMTEMLNPFERCRLSACNQRLRKLLPNPLRIRILTLSRSSCLGGNLFVSPMSNPQKTLACDERLYSDQRYYLWLFDEEEGAHVFLGRHLRQTLQEGNPTIYGYTLGFRPKYPNQAWTISQYEGGLMVPWGVDVRLTVSGEDPRAGQPDSNEEQVLSAKPPASEHACTSCSWYLVDPKGEVDERLSLVPSDYSESSPVQHLDVYSISASLP